MLPWTDIALLPASIAALLIVMALVRHYGPRLGIRSELQRKLVHISTGLYALTLPFTFQNRTTVLVLIACSLVILLVLRLPGFAKSGLSSAIHSVERNSYGEIYLTLAVGIIFWLSADNLVLYVLPILVLTLSDAAAALAGTRYGSKHFEVEASTKSWEGVTIFFLVTWILALVTLLLMTDIDRLNVVVLSLMIAAFGALVEADSWGGLDNLFVPVGVHFLLSSHLTTAPMQLALLALTFIIALIAIIQLGDALGLKKHSARAYVILIFLICAVTAPHNAILPIAVVFAHIAARTANPCHSKYPDLDLIAVSAGAGLFWLLIGEYTGHNALNAFNLTFAAMAILFVVLAVRPVTLWLRLVLTAVSTALLFVLLERTAEWNKAATASQGELSPWWIAALALAIAAGFSAPALFDRYRSVRVLAIAAPASLLLFVCKGLLS